jgi:hypothetical protein
MALIKQIELENGIVVNYHRVVSVNNITNIASIIEVGSYTSKAKRQEEKEKIASHEPMDIFIGTEYISVPYNETLNVVGAYNYLKTLDKFAGAEDDE